MADSYTELQEAIQKATALATKHKHDLSQDPLHRANLITQTQHLIRTLQTPEDQAWQIFFQPHHLTTLRVAHDAGWLRLLVAHPAGISVQDLATQTSSDPSLVHRLLRYLAANGSVDEAETAGTYKPNALTAALTTEGLSAGLRHTSDEYTHTLSSMPAYFRQNGYREPSAKGESIYHFTHGVSAFEQFTKSPERAEAFNTFMGYTRIGKKAWFDIYPLSDLKVEKEEDVLMVDIGGNRGHDLVAFAEKLKQEGKEVQRSQLIDQDLGKVLDEVPADWDKVFIKQPHDFFLPQPPACQGAKLYHMKTVLHDWPDSDCITILTHVRDAMTPNYSRLLINEVVLPDRHCGALAAGLDITMLACLSGKERSEGEWRGLIGKVEGLEVVQVRPIAESGEAVLEVRRVG